MKKSLKMLKVDANKSNVVICQEIVLNDLSTAWFTWL
jgi:hypothetical protein